MAPEAQQQGGQRVSQMRDRLRLGLKRRHGGETTSTDGGLEGTPVSAGGRHKSLQQVGRLMRQGGSASCQKDWKACILVGQQMQLRI